MSDKPKFDDIDLTTDYGKVVEEIKADEKRRAAIDEDRNQRDTSEEVDCFTDDGTTKRITKKDGKLWTNHKSVDYIEDTEVYQRDGKWYYRPKHEVEREFQMTPKASEAIQRVSEAADVEEVFDELVYKEDPE